MGGRREPAIGSDPVSPGGLPEVLGVDEQHP